MIFARAIWVLSSCTLAALLLPRDCEGNASDDAERPEDAPSCAAPVTGVCLSRLGERERSLGEEGYWYPRDLGVDEAMSSTAIGLRTVDDYKVDCEHVGGLSGLIRCRCVEVTNQDGTVARLGSDGEVTCESATPAAALGESCEDAFGASRPDQCHVWSFCPDHEQDGGVQWLRSCRCANGELVECSDRCFGRPALSSPLAHPPTDEVGEQPAHCGPVEDVLDLTQVSPQEIVVFRADGLADVLFAEADRPFRVVYECRDQACARELVVRMPDGTESRPTMEVRRARVRGEIDSYESLFAITELSAPVGSVELRFPRDPGIASSTYYVVVTPPPTATVELAIDPATQRPRLSLRGTLREGEAFTIDPFDVLAALIQPGVVETCHSDPERGWTVDATLTSDTPLRFHYPTEGVNEPYRQRLIGHDVETRQTSVEPAVRFVVPPGATRVTLELGPDFAWPNGEASSVPRCERSIPLPLCIRGNC